MSALAPELIDLILSHLHPLSTTPSKSDNVLDKEAAHSVGKCALLCKAWLPRSRRILFYRLSVRKWAAHGLAKQSAISASESSVGSLKCPSQQVPSGGSSQWESNLDRLTEGHAKIDGSLVSSDITLIKSGLADEYLRILTFPKPDIHIRANSTATAIHEYEYSVFANTQPRIFVTFAIRATPYCQAISHTRASHLPSLHPSARSLRRACRGSLDAHRLSQNLEHLPTSIITSLVLKYGNFLFFGWHSFPQFDLPGLTHLQIEGHDMSDLAAVVQFVACWPELVSLKLWPESEDWGQGTLPVAGSSAPVTLRHLEFRCAQMGPVLEWIQESHVPLSSVLIDDGHMLRANDQCMQLVQ
ncbi:hypothetical protein FB45DRAFT_1005236, partial [Roridomyces roridus]